MFVKILAKDIILYESNKCFNIIFFKAIPVFAKALGKDRKPPPAIWAMRKKAAIPQERPLLLFLDVSMGPSPPPRPKAVLMPSTHILETDLIALPTLLWKKITTNAAHAAVEEKNNKFNRSVQDAPCFQINAADTPWALTHARSHVIVCGL